MCKSLMKAKPYTKFAKFKLTGKMLPDQKLCNFHFIILSLRILEVASDNYTNLVILSYSNDVYLHEGSIVEITKINHLK